MLDNDPVYTLQLPRSVALLCLAALGKQPLEQVAMAHAVLVASLQDAEQRALLAVIEKRLAEQQGA